MDRVSSDSNWSFELTGKKSNVINLGSYNYLGFAENTGTCAAGAISITKDKAGIILQLPWYEKLVVLEVATREFDDHHNPTIFSP